LPDGTAGAGTIQFTVTTDSGNAIFEYNAAGTGETNNTAGLTLSADLAHYPDLVTSHVTRGGLVGGDPASVTVGWTVTNAGTGPGQVGSWFDDVIASADAQVGNGDDVLLARFPHDGALAPGAGYSQTQSVTLPPAFRGRYHLFVKAD